MSIFSIVVSGQGSAHNTLTLSWLTRACGQEPIGPRETIPPGAEASFTEEWHLLPMPFPAHGEDIDLAAFTRSVETQTAAVGGDGPRL